MKSAWQRHIAGWSEDRKINLIHIQLSKPMQNGPISSPIVQAYLAGNGFSKGRHFINELFCKAPKWFLPP
jgi:hypothetical protein